MTTEYKSEFYLHLQPHGALLVDKKSMYYFRLSGEAVEIALILAKNQSLEKTARILSTVKERKITEDDLIYMLDAHPITKVWKDEIPKLTLTGSTETYIPISCTLQLTNGCNLFCSFCYSSSGKRLESELKANDWITVMQNLATRGITDITLTGGEARLIKGFKQVLTTASSLFTNVHLFSNGLHWNPVELDLISDLSNVYVQISIDGSSDIHDHLRGKTGAFRESMETVKQLANRNVPTLIAMTVNPTNYKSIEEVIDSSVSAGANIFRAGITLPVGRGENVSFGLTKDEYAYVQNALNKSVEKHGDVIHIPIWDGDDSGGCSEFSTPGYLQWYIRADGLVTPCQVESVSLGHIQRNTMEELGDPSNVLSLHENVSTCRCMSKVDMPEEVDCPHTYV
ncbi:sporulation killing factor system radical SAM maturase [Massilibacterium senegalense]|uniref:sporulation killing factor system radical SAM maturase n=1 Tax=Massilibacterium senegalense TaxID=1632858 RepID=UPI0007835505|nr:sporulation killing factor system radical SAM maturase [Massilibacterium senegalense]